VIPGAGADVAAVGFVYLAEDGQAALGRVLDDCHGRLVEVSRYRLGARHHFLRLHFEMDMAFAARGR